MQYVTAFFVVMSLNLIPLYMIYEPDSFYAFMLLAGMALAYVYKSGKHYSPQVSVKRSDNAFELKKKGEELAYVYDVKAMIHMGVLTVILVLAAVVGVNAFKPKEQFNTGYEGNKYKDVTMAAVSTFLIDGWRGFSRHTEDVGGLMGGKLGNVSSVRLDNQTDIVLEMTPYSYDSVYLRGFVGTQYNPYENEWTGSYETKDYDATLETETRALLDYYKDGNEKSAIATLRVINVDLAQNEMCVPYYTWNVSQGSGKYLNINYCPVVEGNGVRVYRYYENQRYSDIDLMVPEENLEAVRSFVEKLGYLGSDEEIIEAVRNYFQEYYPYTIKPGKTPKKEDFVNYFLDDNQKGYCSHFASAATLIFRYLGIPARYVEGYAVSYDSFVDGELVDGQNYEDYYSGFSELGKTALVKVNVTDAEAHAWVEVYDNIRGWHLVDVTPTSDEEEELEDFWTMFENIMGDNTADSVETTDGQDKGLKISDSVVKMIYLAIAVLLMISAAVYLVLFGVKRFRLAIAFKNANINDRLIMKYSAFFRKACRKKSALKECRNYRTQLACIADFSLPGDSRGMDENNGMDSHDRADDNNSVDEQNEIEDILTRAGFSGRMISEGEYNKVIKWLDIHLKQM